MKYLGTDRESASHAAVYVIHIAMHHRCCHLLADPCKGGAFPHLREGSLTAQVLHQYTVEGRGSHLLPRSECLSQEISRSQSTQEQGWGAV